MIVVQNQRTDRARLEEALHRVAAAVERQGASGAGAGTMADGIGGYVVAGTSSYHQLDCQLPEARSEAHVVPLEDIRASGLVPCRVCRPPQFGRLATR
jgi:predicted sugar kinase